MGIRSFHLIIYLLLPCLLRPQQIDTAAINAKFLHAYKIHEDSAKVAQRLCFEFLQESREGGYAKGQGDAFIVLGAIHRNLGNLPESYVYFNQSLQIRRMLGDSNRVAAVLHNIAINLLEECKYDSAIATVTYAIQIVESLPNPEHAVLGSEYLLLSNIYDEYLEPDEALKYARKSLWAYQKSKQPELIGKSSYALANRFLSIGQLDSALICYDQAFISIKAHAPNSDYLSDILTNKGIVYTKLHDYPKAGDYYTEAEKLLTKLGDDADWFHWHINKGNWHIEQNDWANGLALLKKAFPEDISDMDYLDQLFLFENLAAAYAALDIPDSAYYYQCAAYAVRDSLYNEHKRKEFIRFQTERHKTEAALGEAKAQKESERARMFFQTALLLSLLLATLAYVYFQNRRSYRLITRQREIMYQQAVDELIQNSELRYLSAGLEGRETEREVIARELHDQLGSSIVTLSWQYDAILENTRRDSANYQPLFKLNDSLKRLYQDVRHIAHQLGSGVLERAGLVPVLEELCGNIEAGKRIEVNFSHFGMESRLGFTYEVNILRIIQELISNVLKYAKATQLMIQMNRIDEVLNIMVEDNGIGFDQKTALQRSGAGLSNIEARLRSLNGTIQFENRPVGGTTVIINIPIPKPENFYEQAH